MNYGRGKTHARAHTYAHTPQPKSIILQDRMSPVLRRGQPQPRSGWPHILCHRGLCKRGLGLRVWTWPWVLKGGSGVWVRSCLAQNKSRNSMKILRTLMEGIFRGIAWSIRSSENSGRSLANAVFSAPSSLWVRLRGQGM